MSPSALGIVASAKRNVTAPTSAYSAAIMADSPLMYWKFDEPAPLAVDTAGGAVWTYAFGTVAGKTPLIADGGYAASSGTASNIANSSSMPAGMSGASVSAEAWVKIPATNVGGPIVKIGSSQSNGWGFGVGGTTWDNGGKQLILLNEAIAWKPTGYTFGTGTYHVVVTRSAGNVFTVYVNGTSVFTDTFTPNAATGGVNIGGYSTRALTSTVDVDNVALFASVLSGARVTAHYNSGAGSNSAVLADSPVSFVKLDEVTTAGVVADSSGNNRSGSAQGVATVGVTPLLADGIGKAISFAGAGHAQGPAGSISAAWQNTDYVTATARVKIDSSAALSGDCYIASSWSGSGVNNRWILNIHNGVLQGLVYTSAGMTTINGTAALTVGSSYTVGITYDGTTAKIWLNGVLEGSAANSGVLNKQAGITTWTIDVARVALSDATHANGITVDEFALFDTALSPTRIAAHHYAGTTPPAMAAITGKALWLRGRDLGANGSSITAWPDASGLQRPLLQAGTAPVVLTGDTSTGSKVADISAGGWYVRRALVTASSQYDASYAPGNCIGIPYGGGYWHSGSNVAPHWYKEETATARIVTGYEILSNGTSGPNTFKLQGSNDDSTWVDLDSRSGITWAGSELKSWTFSNTTAYRFHRIYVTGTNGDGYQRWQTVNFTGTELHPPGDGHLFIVVKADNATAQGGWEWGNGSQSSHYGYSGVIYEAAGLSGTRQTFTPSLSTTAWRVYEVKVSGTTWTALLDGVTQFTGTVSPYWRTGSARLGQSNAANFDGKIAEVLWLDHVATTPEYTAIRAYFAAEHGVPATFVPVGAFKDSGGVATTAATTTWTAFSSSGALDVTVPAVAGDVFELGAAMVWNSTVASYVWGDIATMVSGSPVNWVSTGTSSHGNGIMGLFQEDASAYSTSSGSMPYTVQAGDVVSGNVTFRLYGKTQSSRAIEGGVVLPYIWASKCPTAPVSAALSGSTGSGFFGALTGDIVITASVGDILEVKCNADITPSGAIGVFDAAVIVSGSPVNWVSTGTNSNAGGIGAWRTMRADYEPIGGNGMLYTVQAGDVVAGTVTLRMYGLSSGSSSAIDATASWYVRKTGGVAAQIIRTTAFTTMTSSYAALDSSGAYDLTIPAAVGDWVEIGYSGLTPTSNGLNLDVRTRVAGADVNWVSTRSTTNTLPQAITGAYGDGAGSWNSSSVGMAILYQVQAGDLSGGTVTFRLVGRSLGLGDLTANTTDRAAFWCVRR